MSLTDQTAFDGYRLYHDDQEAFLIGRITDSDSQLTGRPAYYTTASRDVVIGSYDEQRAMVVPETAVDCDSHVIAHNARAFDQLSLEHELSPLGTALRDAWELSQTDVLGVKQAHVYALRDVHEFSRGETATVLGVEPSTVDSHLYAARDSVEDAEQFVETRRRIKP
ncbi:sigma factor-like helix-turn-helix DNA-binding protein [Halobaculum sp. MBLA0143]|uniref:sigma factor-like helix-turn-helix DNA-binding protein n=1 Tax=Halobaculum sp. MBLA0143 TaxID=3079933 RepID=UPI0035267B8D